MINKVKLTGIWLPIVATPASVLALSYVYPEIEITASNVISIAIAFSLGSLIIWSKNRIAVMNGVDNLPLIPIHTSTDPDFQYSYRTKALNKKPPKQFLFKTPSGIVFGKVGRLYVCVIPGAGKGVHVLCVGTSGSGKTSTILADTLLAAEINDSDITFLIIDPKGEILKKFMSQNRKVRVFNPRDRSQSGFDPFYDLSEASSEYEILTSIRRVVYSLIPQKREKKDPFWTDGPRNILMGIFLYGWINKGLRDLPSLVDYTLSKNLKTLINEVLEDVDEYSIIHKYLISFGGEETADETIASLSMNIANAVNLFATDETLRYLLSNLCSERITPYDLEKNINVDVQIADEFLDEYSRVLSLFIGTFCTAFTRRPEGSKPIVMMLDEVGRIAHEGQIEGLQQTLQIGRSRGISVICCTQTWSAIQAVYAEGDAADMLNNFSYRVILQAQPELKDVCEMAIKGFGKYTEKKRTENAGKQKSASYAFEEKNVLREADLLTLPSKNKLVWLSPSGAFMLKRAPYFDDPILKKEAENIRLNAELEDSEKGRQA